MIYTLTDSEVCLVERFRAASPELRSGVLRALDTHTVLVTFQSGEYHGLFPEYHENLLSSLKANGKAPVRDTGGNEFLVKFDSENRVVKA